MTDGVELKEGDLCRHGRNSHPRYRVIHVHEDRVWLRDIDSGADAVVDVRVCHRIEQEPSVADAPHHEPHPGPFTDPPEPPGVPTWPDGTPRP